MLYYLSRIPGLVVIESNYYLSSEFVLYKYAVMYSS